MSKELQKLLKRPSAMLSPDSASVTSRPFITFGRSSHKAYITLGDWILFTYSLRTFFCMAHLDCVYRSLESSTHSIDHGLLH